MDRMSMVRLRDEDVQRAIKEARRRDANAQRIKAVDRMGCSQATSLLRNVTGAVGELAVALAYDLEWTGEGRDFGYDVGGFLEVRSSSMWGSDLPLFSDEPGRRSQKPGPYMLALVPLRPEVILEGQYIVIVALAGWIDLADGRVPGYWKASLNRYLVPQYGGHLEPPAALPLHPEFRTQEKTPPG